LKTISSTLSASTTTLSYHKQYHHRGRQQIEPRYGLSLTYNLWYLKFINRSRTRPSTAFSLAFTFITSPTNGILLFHSFTMRHFSHSLFAIYSVLSFTNAALTKCIQDACFNQMAFDGKDSPNRVERINDCKRALVLAIDDDTIFTKTITRTAPTETEYVSIMPRIGATRRGKRDVEGSLDSVDFFPLEERDTVCKCSLHFLRFN